MTRGMTPDDLFRIQWLSDARISPDGTTVAFTVTRLDEEADDYRSQVWVVPADGSAPPRRFTTGPGKDSAPRWSPDGARLAFLSDRDGGKPQLYLIGAAGGEARRLTSIPQGAGNPVWSPDGRRLLVVVRTGGEEDGAAGEGEAADRATPAAGEGAPQANAKDKKKKTPPARLITTLKYKMNGEGFTYDRRRHLFVVDAESGETHQLTDGDPGARGAGWDDIQPAWSPDSRRVAFISARHPEREYDRAEDVYVVDADGPATPGAPAEPVRVTPGGGSAALPAWSPDGQSIAYYGFADAEDAPRNGRLWVVPATAGSPRCLTDGYDRHLEISEVDAPRWSADGQTIITGVQDRGSVSVLRVGVADGTVTPLVSGPRTVTSYDLHGPSASIAFVASDPTHPAEVFVRDAAGNERQLTDLNAAWRAEVEPAAPEHYTVRSDGVDGVEVDCWVMRPAGFEAGRRYPTLLNIHGGPFAQYGWGFFDEFQVYTGAGYAVVFCNPRGSSGREDDFSRALIGDPAEPMRRDCEAALDEALHRWDFIDPERLGVMGGSYGGYLAGWIIAHTDRFAAACAERGIYNRFSREGTGDIATAYTYLRVRPWEAPDVYWQHSPIRRVQEMRTPVLIMHSEEDLRCPIEQAEQLFSALKRLRRDVRFVRFPGENHELSRNGKPSHRLQRFTHILDWFNEKLAVREREAVRS